MKESISVIIIIIILVFGVILNWTNKKSEPTPLVACPTDLKLCADGSYVGRNLPDCGFLECPKIEEVINDLNGNFFDETISTTSLQD